LLFCVHQYIQAPPEIIILILSSPIIIIIIIIIIITIIVIINAKIKVTLNKKKCCRGTLQKLSEHAVSQQRRP